MLNWVSSGQDIKYSLSTMADAFRMVFLSVPEFNLDLNIAELETSFRNTARRYLKRRDQIQEYIDRYYIHYRFDSKLASITQVFSKVADKFREIALLQKIKTFDDLFQADKFSDCSKILDESPVFYEKTKYILQSFKSSSVSLELANLIKLYTDIHRKEITKEKNAIFNVSEITDSIIRNRIAKYLESLASGG